jgi:hypothetical protein
VCARPTASLSFGFTSFHFSQDRNENKNLLGTTMKLRFFKIMFLRNHVG